MVVKFKFVLIDQSYEKDVSQLLKLSSNFVGRPRQQVPPTSRTHNLLQWLFSGTDNIESYEITMTVKVSIHEIRNLTDGNNSRSHQP